MATKFSKDVVPLTDLKINPGRVVRHAAEVRRPVLLTSRGRGVAVVQSVVDDELAEEERAFTRAVVAGLSDPEAVRDVSLEEAKAQLGLECAIGGRKHSDRGVRARRSAGDSALVR